MSYNLSRCVKNTISYQFCPFYRSTVRFMAMDEEMGDASWRGVPLSDLIGSQSPWGSPEFHLVRPSANHTVLYEVPANGVLNQRPPPPVVAPDKWDSEHVRMPCSPKSLYPCEVDGEMVLKKRWPMIVEALNRPIRNSYELADAIVSYNAKFAHIWKFRALHALFNDHLDPDISEFFFSVTMPLIAKLALKLPKLVQAPIPLLKQHKNHSISLSQQQIGCLLANAFFCTFPRRNTSKRNSEYASYPHINFSSLYEASPERDVMEKITCLCNYLRHVSVKAPRGAATFSRRGVPARARPAWPLSARRVAHLPLHVDSAGHIEDAHGMIQLDFANKYLGGGVLGHGCVQEEIRFVISPELMVSMLFAELLRPNEAFFMIGCQRYNKYSGYGRSFRWDGDFADTSPRDAAGRKRVAVLAIDALPYRDESRQYNKDMVTRELNKAWVGFSVLTDPSAPGLQPPPLATGNWGCGAFGGSPRLKSLIQLMAAAQVRRPMAYYTFADTQLRDWIINTYNLLARYDVTVGQLYQYILKFCASSAPRARLHEYLHQLILDEQRERGAGAAGRVDTSAPPVETPKRQEDSPDLFSIDEDFPSTSSTPAHSGQDLPGNREDSKPKDDKTPPQTKRLFDELQKFDEESGKLNLVTPAKGKEKKETTSRYFGSQELSEDLFKSSDSESETHHVSMASPKNTTKSKLVARENKMADSEKKMADSYKKMEEGETKMADTGKMAGSTSRLFDEMQKFDEEHGRLNLTVPSPSLVHDTAQPADVSMETETDVNSEVKRKITRKITDYFSKKPT